MKFVRELDDFRGSACLVTDGQAYWVVSSVEAMFTGFETLVFEASEEGSVTNWAEVAGGRGYSRDEAIADLSELLSAKAQSEAFKVRRERGL